MEPEVHVVPFDTAALQTTNAGFQNLIILNARVRPEILPYFASPDAAPL